MSKAVYAWMAVFLIVISCAGNRINPNPLFMTTENSEQTILYTGVVSGNDSGNIKLLLKLKRNGSFMSEFIFGNGQDEVFTGNGKYSVKNKTLKLETEDSVVYPVIYTINDLQLIPDNGKGGKLLRTEDNLLERYWQLIELNGTSIDTTGNMEREAHLIFKVLNSRIFGSGGCNSFSGLYKIQDSQLRISGIIVTKMACMNIPYENDFFAVLESADQYIITGDTLKISAKGSLSARLLVRKNHK